MRKLVLGLALLAALTFTSCEPEPIETESTPAVVIVNGPQTPINSSTFTRTGKITELFIDTSYNRESYQLRTSISINRIVVSKEWFAKAKVGYTIKYQEYPTIVYSITP